jgi:hypothetical protein
MPSVRRQLRDLEASKDEGLRDLGSIALEMHNRGNIRLDVLEAHVGDLAKIEDKIRELDPARGDTHA